MSKNGPRIVTDSSERIQHSGTKNADITTKNGSASRAQNAGAKNSK